jgi:hydrogenase expression/formation protein HypC
MCLGIPGRVIEIVSRDFQVAQVDVAGVHRAVNIGHLMDEGLEVGDWVLVHVGFAIRRMDDEEAQTAVAFLNGLGGVYSEPGY